MASSNLKDQSQPRKQHPTTDIMQDIYQKWEWAKWAMRPQECKLRGKRGSLLFHLKM